MEGLLEAADLGHGEGVGLAPVRPPAPTLRVAAQTGRRLIGSPLGMAQRPQPSRVLSEASLGSRVEREERRLRGYEWDEEVGAVLLPEAQPAQGEELPVAPHHLRPPPFPFCKHTHSIHGELRKQVRWFNVC